MSNTTNIVPCGNTGLCFPIFSGMRINGSTIPNNIPAGITSLLQCNPTTAANTVYRRDSSQNGSGQWQMLRNINTPFIFYDVASGLVCLINFPAALTNSINTNINTNSINTLPASLTTPSLVSVPNMAIGLATGPAATPNSSGQSIVTISVPPGITALSLINSINASANFFSPTPSGISLNANLVRTDPNAGHLALAQLRDSQIFVGALQVNGPHQTSDFRIPAAMLIHARATNKSVVSASDAGAYSAGHAVNCSVIHADNDASHVHALVHDTSKAMSLGHGSTAAGQAGCGSALIAGGNPNFTTTATGLNSRYQLMQVGNGVIQHKNRIYSLNKNVRCPKQNILLEDTSPNVPIPPLGCQVCTDVGTGDHAPGSGHGSIAHGLTLTNSLLQTSGDGSAAIGVAKCGEVHAATGLASQAFGRNNLALSPYSMATGQNSVAHMYGQYSQGIMGATNTNVAENCNICQYVRVMTHSYVDCSINTNEAGTLITSFTLTYRLVLGSTPEDAVIQSPDGLVITNYHLPSLICPGIAAVEAQVVSPAITDNSGAVIADDFCANYCFCVSRQTNNNCASHIFMPPGNINPTCLFSGGTIPPAIVGTARGDTDPVDNICGGFTIVFTENIPVVAGVNNPRIRPLPTATNLLPQTRTTFFLTARIMCATFKWTEAPAGYTRVSCVPSRFPVTTVVTVPTFSSANAINSCPSTINANSLGNFGANAAASFAANSGGVVGATASDNTNCVGCNQNSNIPTSQQQSAIGGQIFAGQEFTVAADNGGNYESNALNFIQGMNEQFASH